MSGDTQQNRQFRIRAAVGITVAALFMSGCALGPDFVRPKPDLPAAWSSASASPAERTSDQHLAGWWSSFGDATLTSLMERAVAANLDLKLAESRIRQARAQRAVSAGGLGPSLAATGSYARTESYQSTKGAADQYQTGFDAGWEIDIFGGKRRALEASSADLESAIESGRNVLVSLTAEVAATYIQLRSYQQQLDITRRNLAAQEHTARLTRQRFEGGLVSGLDVASADAQTATTRSQIPLLETSIRQTIYGLSLLLGAAPDALSAELTPVGDIPKATVAVPAGVPSDLLRRRPDIRMAESGIHAATARIGVAEADMFPQFTLSGTLGYRSADSGSLFDWANHFWSIGPSMVWNVFQSGRLKATVEVQKALQEQEMITYQKTVLTALQEVESALVAAAKEEEHRAALLDAVASNRKAVELSRTLYTEGLADFINVLVAQKALYATESALVQSHASVSTDLVALYKALGGGWEGEEGR